jgi:methylated-DNA-[protein]-cysteine S-methyltransferase
MKEQSTKAKFSETQWLMKSKIGPLYLVSSDKGLRGIYWKKQPAKMAEHLRGMAPEIAVLSRSVRQIEEYLSGKRTQFDIPLDLHGTEFQKLVWACLLKIPFGVTTSYGEIARKIKNEKAVRAVGAANGQNPISIIIPCHRVIGADGKLRGYAGGVKIKAQLLQMEQRQLLRASE